ncbi:MAG: leucine-rich repeat domain-containing protein [Treponema sp.]|nr:leucine-rich repeat domain-containing protein [Treponema sp.]
MKKLLLFSFILIFALAGCIEDPEDEDDEIIDEPEVTLTFEEEIVALINEQTEKGTQANPAVIELEHELGHMLSTESNWHKLLGAIKTADKYIKLDLSACTLENHSYNFFHPDWTITDGKDKIIEIILPEEATHIVGGNLNEGNYAFKHFTKLKYISGVNIEHIGNAAFYECSSLVEVNFPLLQEIMTSAFYNCTNLVEADFPLVNILGNNAFNGCTNLESVNFPEVTVIHQHTFYNCTSLETVIIPNAELIDQNAFYNCTSLVEANFPFVTTVGDYAFYNCTSLEIVNIPKITTIFPGVFQNCSSLVNVSFPLVTLIAVNAFRDCTSLVKAEFHTNNSDLVFQDYAFYGCTSLNVLDVRNTLDVVFQRSALGNIGNTRDRVLNLYMFDDDGTKSRGHPPIGHFLGGADGDIQTIITINIIAPEVTGVSQIEKWDSADAHGIYFRLFHDGTHNAHVEVLIERRTDLYNSQ